MIRVQEADKILQTHKPDFGVEEVDIKNALNRLLREDLVADRDFPPYDRVTMDGIAIAYKAFAEGSRKFSIQGVAAAGDPVQRLRNDQFCFEVMTGSILPERTDTVIRYEDLLLDQGTAQITVDIVKNGQNIHRRSSDKMKGSLLVRQGQFISPAELNLAASIGKSTIRVSRAPKVLVVSTGDELVPIDQDPQAHQVRRSNGYAIASVLNTLGIQADQSHLKDNLDSLRSNLAEALATYDVIILSGGVSKGKFDYVPLILKELGVKELFHKIQQRPGKPMWFGVKKDDCTVFGLPGNPVSTFMCTQRYVIPWIKKTMNIDSIPNQTAQLTESISFSKKLVYFPQVKLHLDQATLMAKPVKNNGSGDFTSLTQAHGFMELPMEKDVFEKGECFPVHIYKPFT